MLLEDKYELTKEHILDGELPEFEPVDKPKKERQPMYLAPIVDDFMESTFTDMRELLAQNDALSAELNDANEQINTVNAQLKDAYEVAEVKQGDLSKLGQAEALLNDLEETIDQFKRKREEDGKQIQALSEKVNAQQMDLVAFDEEKHRLEERDRQRENELQQLSNDVNGVLDALESQFAHLVANP